MNAPPRKAEPRPSPLECENRAAPGHGGPVWFDTVTRLWLCADCIAQTRPDPPAPVGP